MSRKRHSKKGIRQTVKDGYGDIRQTSFDPRIRIGRSKPLEDTVIERIIENLPKQINRQPSIRAEKLEEFYKDHVHLMIDLCTFLWRAQNSLSLDSQPTDNSVLSSDSVRLAKRHLSSAMDTIKQAGYVIIDHTQEKFDPGMQLNVVSYEPLQEAEREFVLKTVRPSIYFKEICIQSGSVIVATPIDDNKI